MMIYCLLYVAYIGLFAIVLEVSTVKHYPLFRVYIFRYITKKDIKFFGATFLSRKVAKSQKHTTR